MTSCDKYEAEHEAGNTESKKQGDSAHRRTPVFEKLHTSVFQTPKAKQQHKECDCYKALRHQDRFTEYEAIHDKIE